MDIVPILRVPVPIRPQPSVSLPNRILLPGDTDSPGDGQACRSCAATAGSLFSEGRKPAKTNSSSDRNSSASSFLIAPRPEDCTKSGLGTPQPINACKH